MAELTPMMKQYLQIKEQNKDAILFAMANPVPAIMPDAAKKAGVGLYCGEFGVINQAPVEDTLRWFTDVDKVFRKYNIGCAVWTYKEMDFGLTEDHYASIKDDLLALWCK